MFNVYVVSKSWYGFDSHVGIYFYLPLEGYFLIYCIKEKKNCFLDIDSKRGDRDIRDPTISQRALYPGLEDEDEDDAFKAFRNLAISRLVKRGHDVNSRSYMKNMTAFWKTRVQGGNYFRSTRGGSTPVIYNDGPTGMTSRVCFSSDITSQID